MLEIEKKPYKTIKICILYVRKIGNFQKGLTHDFGQKFELSSLFVFIEKGTRNKIWGCSRKKRSFSRQLKYVSYMSEKSENFQRGKPIILVKNSNFLHCLFLLKIGPEMMSGYVLDRKESFLDNKNMNLISPKNGTFSKGVNPYFWSKIGTFFIVCFY